MDDEALPEPFDGGLGDGIAAVLSAMTGLVVALGLCLVAWLFCKLIGWIAS